MMKSSQFHHCLRYSVNPSSQSCLHSLQTMPRTQRAMRDSINVSGGPRWLARSELDDR